MDAQTKTKNLFAENGSIAWQKKVIKKNTEKKQKIKHT